MVKIESLESFLLFFLSFSLTGNQPFVFWNVSDVSVRNFHIKQPQFWAYNIMNGTDMVFQNISSNATATKAPGRYNWVQNTDGFGALSRGFLTKDLKD